MIYLVILYVLWDNSHLMVIAHATIVKLDTIVLIFINMRKSVLQERIKMQLDKLIVKLVLKDTTLTDMDKHHVLNVLQDLIANIQIEHL